MTDTTEQVVEQPAPDANVTPEVENVADPSPAVESDEKPKGVGKRIDELTRNWRETERDRDYWRELALRNQSPQPKAEPSQPVADEKLKTLADFEYDDAKYQSYIFEQAERRSVDAAKRVLEQERTQQTAAQRKASFQSRSAEFAKTVEDFSEVVSNPRLHISPAMAEAIQDSDDGPALAYHLGKNPDVADKIAQLPATAAARELGRIEARLAYEREKAKEKPVSKTPPPPPKVDGTDPAVEKDPDQMTADEWLKWREKQIAKKRK